ncbi:MAG: hypothetical protein EOP84_17245, partial [Verrucomicrobiaceae bacterium]
MEGTVDKASTVTVNEAPAQVVSIPGNNKWKFEKEIDVTVGVNTIEIEATDAGGVPLKETHEFNVGAAQKTLTY